MRNRYLKSVLGGIIFAGFGYIEARINIWFYHLEPVQATLVLWGLPILLGIVGIFYGLSLFRRNTNA